MAINWQKLIGFSRPYPGDVGSTGMGPDWPDSAGDRERGKFRESAYPRLTTVAVANDDGSSVGAAVASLEEETLLELKAIRIGIQLMLAELGQRFIDLREVAVGE